MARLETPDVKLPAPSGASVLRIAAVALRTIFIATLLTLTVRVSLPQSETIWTAYETPADLIRFCLGLALCVWFVFQLFNGPKDAQGYRTWLYLGLAAVPFALICLFAVW
jgi:TRAP-type C4-dicarboxylate transport system permease small subunit